jgi:hypothetical protein
MISPRNLCICHKLSKETEEILLKIRKNHLEIIRSLAEKYPMFYLETVNFYEPGLLYHHKLHKKEFESSVFLELPVGLFMCSRCGKIITHKQFQYSRCCGECDCGNYNPPKYTIQYKKGDKNRRKNKISRLER